MITAMIIENEVPSAEALLNIIKWKASDVNVVDSCRTITAAIQAIEQHKPDLVFLDVELDGESGFDLFEHIREPSFETIFTTAFDKYTLQAIKASCLEYLLKPIDPDALVFSIEKFRKRITKRNVDLVQNFMQNRQLAYEERRLAIPTQDKFLFVKQGEIVMCEASSNYTIIHLADKRKITSSKNLGAIEEMLPADKFFRTHKSFLVNLTHVESMTRHDEMTLQLINGVTAEVSFRRKSDLLNRLLGTPNQ